MTKDKLIRELVGGGYLKTSLVIDAFKKIDRADFVYENLRSEAYENYPLPIGFGQTISQPLTVAFMLELLQPFPGEKILDIGSGSGWQTCLLAYIASRPQTNADSTRTHAEKSQRQPALSPLVVAIERIPELNAMTEENVSKYNFIKKGIVRAVLGDGSKGFPEEAPFDKIIAAAAIQFPRGSALSLRKSAMRDFIPYKWKRQLKIGGRIVTPIRDSIFVFDKISENRFEKKEYSGFSFVPLIKE